MLDEGQDHEAQGESLDEDWDGLLDDSLGVALVDVNQDVVQCEGLDEALDGDQDGDQGVVLNEDQVCEEDPTPLMSLLHQIL